ncbi:carboxypeptidase regulatory-like domain-containing protein [Bifidobacterium sp. ESL0769]|uniref:carboxypeptidase regulatory-like domain-containing protein n=1 Tax=Bifidobacterium sp. ESL0769 TaxID=2983229 RepID=UPI0023F70357|nr:carboxypeptidase regulatory-like domain-containing protein [Bifidobacterium sp. ESL0769]WEV68135.1 carboxypeptidase regulatory-like domain-containing protein [Bifidobacterium sp. ESL0769]
MKGILHSSSRLKKAVALSVASALALTMGMTGATSANASGLTPVNKAEYSSKKYVPAVESSIGVGSVPTNSDDGVALPGMNGYDSALLRLSVFAPAQDTTITVAGSAALIASAGQDASTTVLAPISGGKAAISASANANIRVEVLASFKNSDNTPGLTRALSTLKTRATAALGAEQTVAVTGLGGVPSVDVRAVYVTADITLQQAGTVTIAGQQFALPQGRTAVSTLVVPDVEKGEIHISSTTPGTIGLSLRGWVSGSAANREHANVEGSYVPVSGANWSKSTASPDAQGKVNVPGNKDRALSLALVSAGKQTANTARTFVDVGENLNGRAHGVVVDGQKGAVPQVEVVESSATQAPVSVRGDAVNVNVLPLGDVLGAPSTARSSVDLAITSPGEGANVDLAKTGMVTLKGTVKSGSAIDRVEVYGNSVKIGTADVQYTATGAKWTMRVASPRSQQVTYKAVGISRDQGQAESKVGVRVTLPDAQKTLVTPDTVVINPDDGVNTILKVNSDNIVFANKPSFDVGKVIVSGVGTNVPEGFIRRVLTVERSDHGWIVFTTSAAMTDVFEQVHIDHNQTAMGSDASATETPNSNSDIVVKPGDKQRVNMVSAGQLSRSGSSQKPAPRFDADASAGVEASFNMSFPGPNVSNNDDPDAKKPTDYAKQHHGDSKAKKAAQASSGIALSAKEAVTLGVHFTLDVDVAFDWAPKVELKKFRTSITGDQKTNASLSAFGKASASYSNDDVAHLHLSTISFSVGPVPVVIVPEASLGFAAKVNGSAKVEYSYAQERSFEKGAEFSDGNWKMIDENHDSASKNTPCGPNGYETSLSGSVDAEAGPTVHAALKIYDVVGPEINAGIKATANANYDGNASSAGHVAVKWKFIVKVIGNGEVKAKFTVPVIDKTLFDKTLASGDVETTVIDSELDVDHTCPADSGTGGTSDTSNETYDLTGKVSDATNGNAIPDATIVVTGNGISKTTTSNDRGEFAMGLPAGEYDVKVTHPGYIDWTTHINMTSNLDLNVVSSLSTPTSSIGEYRAVLTWGEKPADEDSHLIGNTPNAHYHVYYRNKNAYDNSSRRVAWLDRDDVTSYGPETVTFDVDANGTYSYYVHNYSRTNHYTGDKLSTSGAQVDLYRGNEQVGHYVIPTDWGNEDDWYVFSIQNGQVTGYIPQAMSQGLTPPSSGSDKK